MNGAEILVSCLKEQGVDTVFGYPGGSVLAVYDALGRDGTVRLVTSCHEQFACHAADGYARATGRVGVVLATSGPGATNLVTGIANAYMDSTPLIAITGNVSLEQLGRDSFQEIDIAGVTMPITKHNYIVKSVGELAHTVREAFYYAASGRRGPILIDIPKNIFDESCDYVPASRRAPFKPAPNASGLRDAAAVLAAAKRPFLCGGGGIISAGAAKEFRVFAERLQAPVGLTAMGIGAFPRDHVLCTGVVGMHPSAYTCDAMRGCDLFVGVGTRFSERLMANVNGYSPEAKILHIDIDASEIGKNAAVSAAVCGDLKAALRALNRGLAQRSPWLAPPGTPQPHVSFVFRVLSELCGDAVFTTEVGLHQLAACEGLRINHPRRFLTSGGLGAMGFGLGAAIGACIGTGRLAVNISGDGSLNMNLQEIATAVRYRLPLIEVVCDNRQLGMITAWQDSRFDGRHMENATPEIDYEAVARAMGADGYTVRDETEFRAALRTAKRIKRPAVIRVLTEVFL